MGKILLFISSVIELIVVFIIALIFVLGSSLKGNLIAFEIAVMGFFIYCAIWRLRFI